MECTHNNLFRIKDGRSHFWQWDTNQKLIINWAGAEQVHYSAPGDVALVTETYSEDGNIVSDVPNILFQNEGTLKVWVCDDDATIHSQTTIVAARQRPADYVYTETDVRTWDELDERITELEEHGTGGEGGQGRPGVTFIPTVSEEGIISWENDGGLDNPEPRNITGPDGLPGKDGYTPVKGIDYFDGKDGRDGTDGISPIVSVQDIDGGHRVTITDAEGEKTFDVLNGKDGTGGGNGDCEAIIDVAELPTENINEEAFYRVLTGTFVFNQLTQNGWTCHCVETLPAVGESVTPDNVNVTAYYNLADGDVYGYVPAELAAGVGITEGWYPLSALAPAFGVSWSGFITDILDDPIDNSIRLLLETVVWSYADGKWTSYERIGWKGEGSAAVIFNHPGNVASGEASVAFGRGTTASGRHSVAFGGDTTASGYFSHAEGNSSHAEGYSSHAEGYQSHAEGYSSHAEGYQSHAEGNYSHAEGGNSHAGGGASHAEGISSHAEGYSSHAEGNSSHAEGYSSHAEGYQSHAEGYSSHAEGKGYSAGQRLNGGANATVYTIDSTSELIVGALVRYQENINNVPTYHTAKILAIDTINKTITVNRTLSKDAALSDQYVSVYVAGMSLGDNSHSEGNSTIAAGRSQHVQGENNIIDPEYDVNNNGKRGKYAHIVGNGTDIYNRSNAHTLDWFGNAWYAGYVEGTALILPSPNGTRWRITVDDSGGLVASVEG